MNLSPADKKEHIQTALKGFAMGIADIVPGVSGGTIAFITGIYDTLLNAISSVNKDFIKLLFSFKIKEALVHINASFLIPLFMGIAIAIISMSKIMHFFMNDYPTLTWSLFFGLIGASIIYIGKKITNIKSTKSILGISAGAIIAYLLVSLIPVQTPNTNLYIFFSGMIAICAMILPGISGSFILLILGKYAYVTGAVKSPFSPGNLEIIFIFAVGCVIGILSFSKILNYLLSRYHNLMMCFLTGFMIGSMKKIWPWKEVVESKIIRDKLYVIKDINIIPEQLDLNFIACLVLMVIGFVLVFGLEKFAIKK